MSLHPIGSPYRRNPKTLRKAQESLAILLQVVAQHPEGIPVRDAYDELTRLGMNPWATVTSIYTLACSGALGRAGIRYVSGKRGGGRTAMLVAEGVSVGENKLP